jgi:hypothetical protein
VSRVSYPRIEPMDERETSVVNDAFNLISGESDELDWENYAEEGLDEGCFVDGTYGTRLHQVVDNGRIALVPAGAFAVFQMSVAFQTPAIGAVASNRLLRIWSCVYFESVAPASHGIPADDLHMRHEYDVGAGTAATLYSRARKTGSTIASGFESRRHATIAIESWMFGPIANLQWVRLAYTLAGAANAFPSKALLVVDAFDGLLVV